MRNGRLLMSIVRPAPITEEEKWKGEEWQIAADPGVSAFNQRILQAKLRGGRVCGMPAARPGVGKRVAGALIALAVIALALAATYLGLVSLPIRLPDLLELLSVPGGLN